MKDKERETFTLTTSQTEPKANSFVNKFHARDVEEIMHLPCPIVSLYQCRDSFHNDQADSFLQGGALFHRLSNAK
jgi:hypothetical protein